MYGSGVMYVCTYITIDPCRAGSQYTPTDLHKQQKGGVGDPSRAPTPPCRTPRSEPGTTRTLLVRCPPWGVLMPGLGAGKAGDHAGGVANTQSLVIGAAAIAIAVPVDGQGHAPGMDQETVGHRRDGDLGGVGGAIGSTDTARETHRRDRRWRLE